MAEGTTRRSLGAAGLIGPATIVVGLGILIPMAILFRYSLNRYDPRLQMIDAVSPENYVKFFSDPYYLNVLWITVRVAVFTTLICLVLGFPLAYALARTTSKWKSALVIMVVLPLFVGNAVRSAGWMAVLGTKGALNASLIGLGLINQPFEIMFTETAVVVGIIAVNLPYMVLSLQSVIEGIERHVEEAAFSLGAPPATMFRRVLWPLALPGIAAGVILTFILAMNAYATPVLLGGPRFIMMGPLVYGQFQLNNWPFGAAVAFVLMAATLILTLIANIVVHGRYRA